MFKAHRLALLFLGCVLIQSCSEPSTIPTPPSEEEITNIARAIHERVITLERNLLRVSGDVQRIAQEIQNEA